MGELRKITRLAAVHVEDLGKTFDLPAPLSFREFHKCATALGAAGR